MQGLFQIKAKTGCSAQAPSEMLADAGHAVILAIGGLSVGLAGRLLSEIFSIVVAQDGATGCQQALDLRPDLILLDAQLPEMHGVEGCRMLKAHVETRDIPVILLSAGSSRESRLDALKSGCADFIVLPEQVDEILARIEIQLDRLTRYKQLQGQNEQLRCRQNNLEKQAALRTAALSRINQQLRTEIGERVHIEAALREGEEQYRTLAENASDVIIRYDLECRLIYANPACLRLGGLPMASVLGKTPLEQSIFGIDARDYQKLLEKVIATSINAEMQFESLSGAGPHEFYHVRFVAEHDRRGRVMSVLAVARNITALKEVERHLEDSRSQLRELTIHREAGREEERRQIARELHDELGQLLTTLRMRTRLLQPEFIGGDQEVLRERTTSMLSIIDEAVDVVRNVISDLRPGILDLDIASALQWLGHRFTCDHGIVCEVEVPGNECRLDDARTIALFRIAQESLTNVVKHSGASLVKMSFRKQCGRFVLEIRDNGRGFDPARTDGKKTFGLLGIKERVQMLGGRVFIEGEAGRGAAIRVEIPAPPLTVEG